MRPEELEALDPEALAAQAEALSEAWGAFVGALADAIARAFIPLGRAIADLAAASVPPEGVDE